MATHSSTLAWKIPWTEEPDRLQSMGSLSQTWLSDFTFTFHFHPLEKEIATHSSVLAWRIPGMVEPGRLPSMGSHSVGLKGQQQQQHGVLFQLCDILKKVNYRNGVKKKKESVISRGWVGEGKMNKCNREHLEESENILYNIIMRHKIYRIYTTKNKYHYFTLI